MSRDARLRQVSDSATYICHSHGQNISDRTHNRETNIALRSREPGCDVLCVRRLKIRGLLCQRGRWSTSARMTTMS